MTRLLFLLFAGFLSFTTAEVFAGSSPNWPLNPFAWILTVPLYGAHLLALMHVAAWSKRTSWAALYFFGVIFGLYETFITKVIWHGYLTVGGFAMGSIGPWFGLHETVGLALFYHPVTSFMLPVAILGQLFPAYGRHVPPAGWLFGATWPERLCRGALVAAYGIVSGHNLDTPFTLLVTWLPAFAILLALYLLLRGRGATAADARVASPLLARHELVAVVGVLVALYGWSYGNLLPQNLPPLPAQGMALIAYGVMALLLVTQPAQAVRTPLPADSPRAVVRFFVAVFGLAVAEMVLMSVSPTVAAGLGGIAFLAMLPAGALLFMAMPVAGVFRRIRTDHTTAP